MANNLTPIVYDAASKEHKPANIGDHINPAYIAVDSGTGNLMQNKSDNGLGVYAQDFVSPIAGNMLSAGADGKLYVGAGDNILSKQQGNYLRYGNDGGIFLDGNDVLSNGRANILHTSDRDGRVELLEEDLVDLKLGSPSSDRNNLLGEGSDGKSMLQPDVINHMIGDKVNPLVDDVADAKAKAEEALDATKHFVVDVVSKDRKNVITEGSDKGAYLAAEDIVDVVEEAGITGKVDVQQLINLGTDPLLGKAGDKLISGLSVQYNQVSGRLDIIGVNGQSVANTTIPTAVALLERVTLEDNPAGQPSGTYIHFEFRLTDQSVSHVYLNVNKLAQFYSAGDGIKISPDGAISINADRIEELAGDVIDDELGTRGKITAAIEQGVEDALETRPIKDKIAEITEEAIKRGDVSIVSDNPNNMLKKGTDGGAFLDKADIPAAGPSADAGNALSVGSDGKLFFQPVADYGTLD